MTSIPSTPRREGEAPPFTIYSYLEVDKDEQVAIARLSVHCLCNPECMWHHTLETGQELLLGEATWRTWEADHLAVEGSRQPPWTGPGGVAL